MTDIAPTRIAPTRPASRGAVTARGGAATLPTPTEEDSARADAVWVTIVWNDPINLMSYVTYVFRTLLGHPQEVAEALMLDVHHRGRAAVAHGTREEMEVTVTKLHGAGLWATMQQDR